MHRIDREPVSDRANPTAGDEPVRSAPARRTPFLRLVTEAPEITCPKCGNQVHGTSCGRCGLATSHMARFTASQPAVAEEVLEAWRAVRAAWADPAAHDRLLMIAGRTASYTWLATRYRELARREDPIARERVQLVQRAAELTLLAGVRGGQEPEQQPYQATRRLLVAMLIILALGVLLTHAAAGQQRVPARVRDLAPAPAAALH